MAVATVKATNITALDASPRTMLEAGSVQGKLRVYMDTIATTTTETDDIGDIWMLAEVPSNAKIVSIKMYNDDLAASGLAADIGLYNGAQKFTDSTATAYAAEGVIAADAYASAWTTELLTANTAGVELAFEARDINLINNFVWEDGGLPEDPLVPLRICATITTVATTPLSGDVSIVVMYSVE